MNTKPHSTPLADRLALMAIAAMVVIALATCVDYGIGSDEWNTERYGAKSLAWYLTLGHDTSSFDYFDLHYYGAGIHALIAALGKLAPGNAYLIRHGVGMAVGIIGLAGTWRLGRRLGGPWAGLAALLILAFTPYYWGQMAILPEDTPFLAAMTWALLAILRYADELPSPRLASVIGLGVIGGVTAGLRVGAVPILVLDFAFAVALWMATHGAAWRAPVPRLLWQAPLILAITWLVMLLCWPWALVAPVANPLDTLTHFSKLSINFEFPFWGERVRTTDLPWTYVPGYLLAKLPLLFLAGIVLVPLAAWLDRHRWRDDRRFAPSLLVAAFAAVMPVAAAVASHATLYDGVRHFLFILAPLAALAGFALVRIAQSQLIVRAIVAAAGAIAAILVLRVEVDLHPYEYIWFNELAGGVRGTANTFEQEYWATAETALVRKLRIKLRAEGTETEPHRYKLCVWWNEIAELVPSNWIKTENDDPTDFVIALQRFPCAPLDDRVLVKVERDGVPLGWVADRRGAAKP